MGGRHKTVLVVCSVGGKKQKPF